MVVTISLNEQDEKKLNDLIQHTGEANKSFIFRSALREMHKNFFVAKCANRNINDRREADQSGRIAE
ncbi:MAG: hypothetical protein IJW33_07300 [Lentisphaeria bacterium]|nr:hypothetical protein [Lentisphaeria bacterium]MBQ9787956.1 hypothetical protein [Lentisphaeria bacterium]